MVLFKKYFCYADDTQRMFIVNMRLELLTFSLFYRGISFCTRLDADSMQTCVCLAVYLHWLLKLAALLLLWLRDQVFVKNLTQAQLLPSEMLYSEPPIV